jgi:hypothetical protein
MGVALGLVAEKQPSELSDDNLELQLAIQVGKATANFEPSEIQRLKVLANSLSPGVFIEANVP